MIIREDSRLRVKASNVSVMLVRQSQMLAKNKEEINTKKKYTIKDAAVLLSQQVAHTQCVLFGRKWCQSVRAAGHMVLSLKGKKIINKSLRTAL